MSSAHGLLHCPPGVSAHDLFTRHEIVGKGAYGQVYKAVHNATGTVVALKIIDLDTADDDISEIQREVQLLTQLRDADRNNCTLYYGSWLEKTKLWIAMEYASGGSLRTIMKSSKTIEERFTVVIIREVLVALSYLHRQGIIHRDIKAANVLLTHTGKILLCDFGVAAHLHSSNKRSTFTGTPYWMAPEVIQSKLYDTKADIWSLGITLYELCMGNPPFTQYEALRALQLIPRTKPATLEGAQWSPGIREFLSLCLQENPSERLNADELLKSKWIKSASKVTIVLLRDLIFRYTTWVTGGGVRQSLVNVEASPDQSGDDESSTSSWDFGTPLTHEAVAEEYTGDNLGTDTGYASQDAPRAPTVPPPRQNHPLLRMFESEPPMPVLSGFSSRIAAPAPIATQGLGFSIPAETVRPRVTIPSLGDDSDEDSPTSTTRLQSPATVRPPAWLPTSNNPLPPPPPMPAAVDPQPPSPKLNTSPRQLQRSQTPPSPFNAQNGFSTPTEGAFPDVQPAVVPMQPVKAAGDSPSVPVFAARDGVDKAVVSPPVRGRTNTMPSQLSISSSVNGAPTVRQPPSRGRVTNEPTLAPVPNATGHARKHSGTLLEPRGASPAPFTPAFPKGPPLRPLDYAALSAGQVHVELERTIGELSRWLQVLEAGFEQLAS